MYIRRNVTLCHACENRALNHQEYVLGYLDGSAARGRTCSDVRTRTLICPMYLHVTIIIVKGNIYASMHDDKRRLLAFLRSMLAQWARSFLLKLWKGYSSDTCLQLKQHRWTWGHPWPSRGAWSDQNRGRSDCGRQWSNQGLSPTCMHGIHPVSASTRPNYLELSASNKTIFTQSTIWE